MSQPRPQAIVIGVSAGALDALSLILPSLPADYVLAILIVVHQPPDKKTILPELLQAKCRITVKEAEDKELVLAGTVYIAPPDYHLLVETDKRLSLSSEEPVQFSRPSIDVLFESAADAYGQNLIGVVLTGANSDGAYGLASVRRLGGIAIVQDPEFAQSPEMPRAALEACPEAFVMNLEEIIAYMHRVS